MTTDPLESLTVDPRHHVASFFRIERWEIPPDAGEGAEAPSAMAGRAPIDAHLRGSGGGLRTGALITVLDSLGGLMSGLAVHPRWIVTTNLMVTVAELSHHGPLGLSGRVLRQGRNSVVSALHVVDEGAGDRPVAAATMTSAVLDPGAMRLDFERPLVVPMPPPSSDQRTPEEFFCIEPGEGPITPPPARGPAPQPVGHPARGCPRRPGRRGRLPVRLSLGRSGAGRGRHGAPLPAAGTDRSDRGPYHRVRERPRPCPGTGEHP